MIKLNKEDAEKIAIILSELSKTNTYSPEVYFKEVQPLIVKLSEGVKEDGTKTKDK